jgi:Tol biopolymer transport system component
MVALIMAAHPWPAGADGSTYRSALIDPLPTNGLIVFAHFRDPNYSWDIRSIQPNGRDETWLSEDRARYEAGPQISPDGTKIAVEFDHDLLVMNVDGSGRRLLTDDYTTHQEADIRWSPDGTTLAFTSDIHGYGLYTVPAAGGTIQKVSVGITSLGSRRYSWAPDSSNLVFSGWDSALQKTDLYVATPDGSQIDRITTTNEWPTSPDWSPDGSSIIYLRNGAVWTIHPDGSSKTQLAGGLTKHLVDWSPDGQHILYLELGTEEWRALGVMDADGQHQHLVTVGTAAADPSWSPDGTQIVFRGGQDHGEGEIYTVGLSGAEPVRLTFDRKSDLTPDWGPACSITGTAGPDVLAGTEGPDLICGGAGDDTITGAGGDDVVLGGRGEDHLRGGSGNDVVAGQAGLDDLFGSGGDDTVNGLDRLAGETLTGGSGFDSCRKDVGDPLVSCEVKVQPV